jgi:anoctamin-10
MELTFSDHHTAAAEFTSLVNDLRSVGLHTEVRSGYDQTILVFIQAPKELLGITVHHSRYDSLISIHSNSPPNLI